MQITFNKIKISTFFTLIVCCSLFLVTGYAIEAKEDIAKLINNRLSYMESVALFKYNNGLLVEDIPRETTILQNINQKADKHGLDSITLATFFQELISSAKDIQYRFLDQWRLSQLANNDNKVSLCEDIRPKLDEINDSIIEEIWQLINDNKLTNICYEDFISEITVSNLPDLAKERLFNSLINIKRHYYEFI